MMTGTTQRVPYMDWVRVLTVLLLVPFHSALPFIWGYYWWIYSDQKNLAAQALVNVLDQYHMPLLFLVAGAATWFSLGVRTGKEYIIERIKRLFIPTVFAALVFVTTNHFLSQYHYYHLDPENQLLAKIGLLEPFGSFLQHYPTILQEKLIPFTTGWNPGLLWFIWYLLIYTLVLFPLFLLIRRKEARFLSWLARFFEKRGAVFLLFIPIALVQIYPPPAIVDTWTFHTFPLFYYVFFFIFGFFLVSEPRIQEGLRKSGPIAVIGGLVTMTLFMLLVFPPEGRAPLGNIYWSSLGSEPGTPGHALYWTLRSINGWFWIIGLLYLGRRFLNFSNRFLRYGNEAVLPFYIMHQFAIVVVGFFVLNWDMDILPKYAIMVVGALALTLLLYEGIRRWNVTRFLMGMRPK